MPQTTGISGRFRHAGRGRLPRIDHSKRQERNTRMTHRYHPQPEDRQTPMSGKVENDTNNYIRDVITWVGQWREQTLHDGDVRVVSAQAASFTTAGPFSRCSTSATAPST